MPGGVAGEQLTLPPMPITAFSLEPPMAGFCVLSGSKGRYSPTGLTDFKTPPPPAQATARVRSLGTSLAVDSSPNPMGQSRARTSRESEWTPGPQPLCIGTRLALA
jgi:hypothetical protein